MGVREGTGEARRVRIWPLLAFAVGSALWPATWWWSQLHNARGKMGDGGDSEASDDAG